MALKLKSINWKNIQLPKGVNTNLFMVASAMKENNWFIVQYEDLTYKLIITNRVGCKMSVYLSTMTVQTAMNHPTKGKTQLTRKNVNPNEFKGLLKNPRLHTNKGYY